MNAETASGHLCSLAQCYLGRGPSSGSPETRVFTHPHRGPLSIETGPDDVMGYGIRHDVHFDPDKLIDARSSINMPALGDAMVLETELVDDIPNLGPVHRYRGIRKGREGHTGAIRTKIVEGHVVSIGGRFGTHVTGSTSKAAIAMAKRVVDAGAALDWNAVEVVMPRFKTPLSSVTDVAVRRLSGETDVVIELNGLQPVRSRWKEQKSVVRPGSTEAVSVLEPVVILLPASLRVVRASDGRWIQYSVYARNRYENGDVFW